MEHLKKIRCKLVDCVYEELEHNWENIDINELEILGPSPCIITRIKENYRWQIIIKGNIDEKLRENIKELLYELNKSVYNEIRISIDINPNNMS